MAVIHGGSAVQSTGVLVVRIERRRDDRVAAASGFQAFCTSRTRIVCMTKLTDLDYMMTRTYSLYDTQRWWKFSGAVTFSFAKNLLAWVILIK